MDRWVPSQRRTTKPRRPARVGSGFQQVSCRVIPQISESSLASQRSCGVPSQRRTTVSGAGFPRSRRAAFPRQGHQGFLTAGLPGSGIVPRQTYRERNFRPGVAEAIFPEFQDSPSLSRKLWIIHREAQMPRRGSGSGFQQVTGLRGAFARVTGERDFRPGACFSRISRSVDSICWQGADLEAVAFSCTGRRLARAANGLGFRV